MTIIGLGEDGPEGLGGASRHALAEAEVVMGPARHLDLVPETGARRIPWPVPFADGLPLLECLRGQQVVVLASGDPFWFGAGSVIARRIAPSEWRALPGPSVFSLVAARLGWPLEKVVTLGLHAAPIERLRPYLARGQRLIATLRDGEAVKPLAEYLVQQGFGETRMHICEAIGGPRARLREVTADAMAFADVLHPVTVALEIEGDPAVTRASGKPDDLFETDGQITKRPVRALTLSALAPKPGERLWDIGAGTGSIAIEWLMTHPATEAVAIEARPDRAERVERNARALGQDRLQVVRGTVPEALEGLAPPDAVFVGGGLTEACLAWLVTHLGCTGWPDSSSSPS